MIQAHKKNDINKQQRTNEQTDYKVVTIWLNINESWATTFSVNHNKLPEIKKKVIDFSYLVVQMSFIILDTITNETVRGYPTHKCD